MIDLKPTVNPLETPMAKPSEIVRQWPVRMWTQRVAKRTCKNGEKEEVRFCAIGILNEIAGYDWGDPEDAQRNWKSWGGGFTSRAQLWFRERYDLSEDEAHELAAINDCEGKVAAADFLERLGK